MSKTAERLMTAGDVAKVCGVTAAAIRLWEQRGALRPMALTVRGVRLYAPADVERVRLQRATEREARGR